MSNLNKLSGLEQNIYFLSAEALHSIIAYDTIKSWGLAGKGVLDVTLSRMCKKGWLVRLKRGVYLVSKPSGAVPEDALYAAQSIFGGYIGFSTALNLHGLMDEMPFTIYLVTESISKSKQLGDYLVKAVALGKRAVGMERKGAYLVSNIPKSIYDSFYLPEYGGGYASVLKAIHLSRMGNAQWKEFVFYLGKFSSGAFCQKIGYMLELLKKTKIKIPAFVFQYLAKRVRSVVILGAGKGAYNKKWRVVDAIGEQALLSWWYHG